MHTEFLLETLYKRQPLVTTRCMWLDNIKQNAEIGYNCVD